MKSLILTLLFVSFGLSSFAYTKSQAFTAVRICRQILKASPAAQKAASKRAKVPVAELLRRCRMLDRYGDEGSWRAYQRERKAARRSTPRSGGGRSDDTRSCMASSSCGSLEHCVFGSCVPESHVCGGDPACPSGESCKDNRCQ